MGSRFTEKIPEIVRFFFSGVLGTLLDYAAYKAIYDSHIFPFFRPTLSWALAYALSVVWQHSLHAFFVFGGYGGMGYWRSLGAMYVAYSGSILTSPVINYALIEYAKVDHGVAFLATLLITGMTHAHPHSSAAACPLSSSPQAWETISSSPSPWDPVTTQQKPSSCCQAEYPSMPCVRSPTNGRASSLVAPGLQDPPTTPRLLSVHPVNRLVLCRSPCSSQQAPFCSTRGNSSDSGGHLINSANDCADTPITCFPPNTACTRAYWHGNRDIGVSCLNPAARTRNVWGQRSSAVSVGSHTP